MIRNHTKGNFNKNKHKSRTATNDKWLRSKNATQTYPVNKKMKSSIRINSFSLMINKGTGKDKLKDSAISRLTQATPKSTQATSPSTQIKKDKNSL